MCVLTLNSSHRPDGKMPCPDGRLTFARCLQGGGVWVGGGTVTFDSCTITGNTATYVRAHPQNFPSPRWEFLLTCPIDSHLSIRIHYWFYQGDVRASHACKLPIAPMGDLRFARCLQGGGIAVFGGSVSIVNSQIYFNTAVFVRARLQKFPSPRWDFHMFCTYACRPAVCASTAAR